ncbi:MAG TPA: DUF1656 domain-containing protein [Geomonas sp.]|nr:DUF1656 domain-containing protein [Geomonas sp.]
MIREIPMLDALVPSLLLSFLASIAFQVVTDRVLGRLGIYRHVWHPTLFRLCLFVCTFGAFGLALLRG